jgi:hypothetical protein
MKHLVVCAALSGLNNEFALIIGDRRYNNPNTPEATLRYLSIIAGSGDFRRFASGDIENPFR